MEPCDILGLGAVAVDDLLYVKNYPPAERKVRVLHRLRQCGGLTGTALVAAARLEATCAYAGALGEDELSEYVRAVFEEEGIDCSEAPLRADAIPAFSTIIVDETSHSRTIFSSTDGFLGPDPDLPDADCIRNAKVLLIDHHGLEGTLRAVRIARENGRAVVADFERHPGPDFETLLPLVDHLILSQPFAEMLTGFIHPSKAAETLGSANRATVVVTCGEQGSWFYSPECGESIHQGAFQVDVVDTTGCGDVFHGAYAAALAKDWELAKRVRFATAVAALKAMQRGGQSGCPSLAQAEAFLSQGPDDQISS